jgi:hypothetical protein
VSVVANISPSEILTHVIAIKNVSLGIQIIHPHRVELCENSEFRLAISELLVKS